MPALTPTRARRSRNPFIQLDVAYFRRIRPLLTPAESQVYEELVIECDGWDRPTRSPEVAKATGLHAETVRRAIHELDRVGLVRRQWLTTPTSPHGLQRIEILRDFETAISLLTSRRTTRRGERREVPIARSDDIHLANGMPPNSADGSHLIARSFSRSDPDPSSLPSFPPAALAAMAGDSEGPRKRAEAPSSMDAGRTTDTQSPEPIARPEGREEAVEHSPACPCPAQGETDEHSPTCPCSPHTEPAAPQAPAGENIAIPEPPESRIDGSEEPGQEANQPARRSESPSAPGDPRSLDPATTAPTVPDALVLLVRSLWGTDVAFKAARRYVGSLLAIGDPPASPEEVARYLKSSAKTERVKRASFPVAVACMPEEFADWLARYRKLRVLPTTAPPTPPPRPLARTLSPAELSLRASELCARLANANREWP